MLFKCCFLSRATHLNVANVHTYIYIYNYIYLYIVIIVYNIVTIYIYMIYMFMLFPGVKPLEILFLFFSLQL